MRNPNSSCISIGKPNKSVGVSCFVFLFAMVDGRWFVEKSMLSVGIHMR